MLSELANENGERINETYYNRQEIHSLTRRRIRLFDREMISDGFALAR